MPRPGDVRAEQQQLSPRRRRLFLAITLAAPWVLLLLVELLLRVVGYGSAAPLFVEAARHRGWLEVNPRVGERRPTRSSTSAPTRC